MHPPHTEVFGHRDRNVELGRFPPRTLQAPTGLSCPTEVFASDPDDNQFIAANCFTSSIYSCLDQPYEPFDELYPRFPYDKYPRLDKWRLGRECLEALSGANRGHLLYDQHFPGDVRSTYRTSPKALMLGGGYVGGDLSFEPYCLTFIYTDQKPAGMVWIASKKYQIVPLAARLTEIYDIG